MRYGVSQPLLIRTDMKSEADKGSVKDAGRKVSKAAIKTAGGLKSAPAEPAQKARKRMTGVKRKLQIVRVASNLFAKKGFRGTTTREIAEKARISEAVIFKHFARKDDLYRAIIDSRCTSGDGEPRLLKLMEGKTGKALFTEVASFLIAEHRADPSFLRLLMYSALESHGLSEIFIRTRGLELIEALATGVRGLIKDGEFRKVDPVIAARAFLGMVIHYSVSQEVYGLKKRFKTPDKDIVRTFVDIFFQGMSRRLQ